jgi:hypothetical protein
VTALSTSPFGTPAEIGDPRAATAIAGHLAQMAGGLESAGLGFGRNGATWSGAAAAAFAAIVAAQPKEFLRVADACRTVSHALHRHAEALTEAHAIQRRATAHVTTDPTLAQALTEQARATASSSAVDAARLVRETSQAAPDKPNLLMRLLRRGAELMSDLRLGAVEATESAVGVALSVNQFRLIHRPIETSDDAARTFAGVMTSARDPAALARAIVDWDTWQSNPARAAGHLAPDVVAAFFTAGTATTARGAEIAARQHAAVDYAHRLDDARRTVMREVGTNNRNELVNMAASGTGRRSALPWRGEGGTRLSARDSVTAERFWFTVASRERLVTTVIDEISQEVGGLLVGTEYRLKAMESFKRKLATQQALTGEPVERLLARAHDSVRYTVVFGDRRYAEGVVQTSAALDRWGFTPVEVKNYWQGSPRYRGLNTTWMHARSGTVIEMQFHTGQTYLANTLTHDMYERMRLPDTPLHERERLNDIIASAYARAPRPNGAETLTHDSLPPPTPPKDIELPPDYTAAAAGAGAVTTGGMLTVDRASADGRPTPPRGAR